MKEDTFHGLAILETLKKFWNNSSAKFPFNNRGEVDLTPTPEPTPEPTPAPTDWKADLDPDVKGHPVLEKYSSKNDAVKALVAAQKLIGRENILIPPDGSPDEDWHGKDGVYSRLGRPETVEGYKLPDATELKLPEGMPVDQELVKGFTEVAHKMGFNSKQVEGLYRWYMEQNTNQFNTLNETVSNDIKVAETNLRQTWGTAYDGRLALAKKTLSVIADEEATAFLAQGLGNDPRIIKMFAKVGEMLSEDQLAGKPKGLTMTPDEAIVSLKTMEADLKGPLYDVSHPQHKEYVSKRMNLYQQAYPG